LSPADQLSEAAAPEPDDLLALALASGATHAEAATKAGCSAKTVQRRLHDPAFRARVSELRRGMVDAASGRLTGALTEAADALRGLLNADSEAVRLGAARSLIEMASRMHETVLLQGEIEELRALLANRDKPALPLAEPEPEVEAETGQSA
jgi:hypothetical protein